MKKQGSRFTEINNLLDAFGLSSWKPGQPKQIAFTGAGGKTSALFQLANDMIDRGSRTVVVTTTTHISVNELKLSNHLRIVNNQDDLAQFSNGFPEGILAIVGSVGEDEKVNGVALPIYQELSWMTNQFGVPILIEADGSRRKPLKAPAAHEPVVPSGVDLVVVVIGISGIWKPLDEKIVHRPNIYSELAGLAHGELVTPQAAARVLIHPDAGLKGVPERAKVVLLINQVHSQSEMNTVKLLVQKLGASYSQIVAADVKPGVTKVVAVYPKIAGIILAAGASTRFGRNKQVAFWKGKPLLQYAIETAYSSGLSPIRLVLGADAGEILKKVDLHSGLIKPIINRDWKDGLSTSIRVGLQDMPEEVHGAVFLLGDQPLVSKELVHALKHKFAHTKAEVIVPRYANSRVNPVLFSSSLFSQLSSLQGDSGGRSLLTNLEIEIDWLDWQESGPAFDVDTPDDYRDLIEGNL